MKISATLITLNEEENLPRALASLSFCDEILIVDSGSSDRTVEIARDLGATVVVHDWDGYETQKNFAASEAVNHWILALDADEELSPLLRAEIERLAAEEPRFDAYDFPRRACYLGRWIRGGGWYPDRKIRLYDRRRARWVGEYVHERVICNGAVGSLRGDLLHYTCNSIEDHARRIDRYTTLAARELVDRGRSAGLLRLALAPGWTFLRSYLLQGGFRDGFEGFVIARMAAYYVFLKYAKARRLLADQ